MVLEIPAEVVKRPKKKQGKKKGPEPIDPRILEHPRVLHPKVMGDDFLALKPKGILSFDPKYRPSKFRFYCEWARKEDIKRVPFAGWSDKKKCWILPISIETLRLLTKIFPGFMMTPDAFKISCRLRKASKKETALLRELAKIKNGEVDAEYVEGLGKLQPWLKQKVCIAACETAWEHGYGLGNFCEQGLGKTCMALVAIDRMFEHVEDSVAIVYAPKGILYTTWVADTRKFCKNVRPFVPTGSIIKRGEQATYTSQYDWEEDYEQDGLKRTRMIRRNGRPNVFLINHECGRTRQKDDPDTHNDLVLALVEIFKSAKGRKMLIIDEGDKFSNPSAKQTKAAAEIAKYADDILVMTGTPGMPEKYYGLLQLIDKKIFPINKGDFEHRYIEKTDIGDYAKITGYRRLTELFRRADQFSIRYTQEEMSDIPKWQRVEVEVPLSKAQQEAYDATAKQLETFYEGHNITKTSLGAKLHGLRNICSGFVKDEDGNYVRFKNNAKLNWLLKDLEDELAISLSHPEHTRKAFVVVQYKEDIELLREALDKKRASKREEDQHWKEWNYTIVTGDVTDEGKTKDRTEAVLSFRQVPDVRIFLATEAAISHGHHLVPDLPMVCDVGYIYSSGYKPETRDQVIKRIIREGQTRTVRFKEPLCEGTIDESIADAIQEKLNICSIVNGDNFRRMMRGRQR